MVVLAIIFCGIYISENSISSNNSGSGSSNAHILAGFNEIYNNSLFPKNGSLKITIPKGTLDLGIVLYSNKTVGNISFTDSKGITEGKMFVKYSINGFQILGISSDYPKVVINPGTWTVNYNLYGQSNFHLLIYDKT